VRGLGERVGQDLVELLKLLLEEEVHSTWVTRREVVAVVSPDAAATMRSVLMREGTPEVTVIRVTGLLYEADAKNQGFKLKPENEPVIQGTYPEELTEEIRRAWNHEVVLELRRVAERLERSVEPTGAPEFELMEIVRIIGPEPGP
jgi:hypothetical protein